jgi:AraC family transcriptional activator of pyochelin receptor
MQQCEIKKTLTLPMNGIAIEDEKKYRLKLSSRDKEALKEAKKLIEMQPVDQPLSLKQLSRKTGLNEYKLKKGFKELFTRTPYDYHLEIKMKEAKQLLLDPESSIYMVAYQVGYQHVSNFCIQFKKRFGVTPLRFKVNTMAVSI